MSATGCARLKKTDLVIEVSGINGSKWKRNMVNAIFCIEPSFEEDRPYIDHAAHVNAKHDWLSVGQVLKGQLPAHEFPDVRVKVDHEQATLWDCYREPGTFGFYSPKVARLLFSECGQGRFTLFPASLNGQTYYLPRCDGCLDVLNADASEFKYLGADEKRFIYKIIRHVFDASQIPESCVFCIPQMKSRLYCTQKVVQAATAMGIRGLYAERV